MEQDEEYGIVNEFFDYMDSLIEDHEDSRGFSDEEILALGLYPKSETYKMSLISRILGKK